MTSTLETPETEYELSGVLYVGETRARLLAEAGIRTLDDLRAADAERIGSVKGVGLKNGQRIKEWLAARDARASLPITAAGPEQSDAADVSPDLDLAAANQAVQDEMEAVNAAIARIQRALPQGVAHRKFDRQVDKLLSVLSELAEGPDTLRPKQFRRALKMLHLIAALLDKFTGVGTLSEKIVLAFAEELRDRRRRLQDILDPKK
jgi:hypothetical protein